jgi:hypothetical protein
MITRTGNRGGMVMITATFTSRRCAEETAPVSNPVLQAGSFGINLSGARPPEP